LEATMLLISVPVLNSIISVVVVLTIVAFFAMKPILNRRRRKLALATPFPTEWEVILDRNLPIFDKLNDDLKSQFRDLIRIFLAEKTFVGYHGVEITDEVKVTVAGQACLLLLNRDAGCYPLLSTIVMYPSAFVSGDGEGARLGESWTRGSIILAWDHSKGDARNFHDGHNLVIHEFAHQLDQLDGSADGAPILEDHESYLSWAKVLSSDYLKLRHKVEDRRKDVLDKYGATNPAEFFAVSSETFFEMPKKLEDKHPELFNELLEYYRVDPREWY
jgi:Mlc titration factor MtfA (ptsG expression regulator)